MDSIACQILGIQIGLVNRDFTMDCNQIEACLCDLGIHGAFADIERIRTWLLNLYVQRMSNGVAYYAMVGD